MISKKNFFTISVMMAVVFFLFMFTGGAKLVLSHYDINEYTPNDNRVSDTGDAKQSISDGGVLYLGDGVNIRLRLNEWCVYNKRSLTDVTHGSSYEKSENELSMLVIDGASLKEEDIPFLIEAGEDGLSLVFASMPTNELISKHTELAALMGIRAIQSESTALIGLHLYEGFLLGGDCVYEASDEESISYQDFNTRVPWYILESGSKVYMDGYLNKAYEDADASYTPPIIWRYNTGKSYVYAINSDFMSELSALGIYTAVESTRDEVSAYPVINAQNLVLINFPTFAEENTDTIEDLYARKTMNFLRSLLWPAITQVSSANKLIPTYMLSSKLDYGTQAKLDESSVENLFELIRENHGEAAVSLKAYRNASEKEKIEADLEFFDATIDSYDFYSAYIGDCSLEEAMEIFSNEDLDISTVVTDYDKSKSLILAEDNTICLSPTSSSAYYSYKTDFTLRSVETALGYSLAKEDLSACVYPKSEDDHLQNFTDDFSGCIHTLYENFDGFDATAITECGNRVRNYLNMEWDISVSEDQKEVTFTSDYYGEEQYFILRCSNKSIKSISEGSYEKLEDGVYLITSKSSYFVVELEEASSSFFSNLGR